MTIPAKPNKVILSPIIIKPVIAVIGGTVDMINIDIREPTCTKAWNKNKSPITKPINPEKDNHNQVEPEASKGNIIPRVNRLKTEIKARAIKSLIKLTDIEPTFLPADSKETALIVQHKAVARAAISPKYD